MPGVDEITRQSPLNAALDAGIEALSQQQDVAFLKYVRVVLPLDGCVFWVRASLASALTLKTARTDASDIVASGSLHYATVIEQREDATGSTNEVMFTSEVEIQALNDVNPQVLYIATFEGVRFAFAQRGRFYAQAGVHHYVGSAVYSDLVTQIVDDARSFNQLDVVVSNSLPIWLSLNSYQSMYSSAFSMPVALYPSFLVPTNLAPPFGSVHISPEGTEAIQSAPLIGSDSSHYQLVRDRVRVTLYGLRNADVLSFVDFINQFTLDTDAMGIMNMPVARDEKRNQVELATLSQKKTIEYEVSYYQQTARTFARKLITGAIVREIPDYLPGDFSLDFSQDFYL